ncbi:hypothetical protein UF75_4135 [Desulfosporosinus sp. I2]|uniref:hypothetical protein n=1 Tax=Desulfosporosinus sp. I2 TaxID=1617025 RepID=UPI0005F0177C|nr:hypothetical protein [Desulfosporosinus sp. I2]KJR45459.1 hypothetical protein UF75_4135 [Desulfosporosinus sp. I2]
MFNVTEAQAKKPIYWQGFGGSVGVRERGMYGEKYQELGRNPVAPAKRAGRSIQSKKRTANAYRSSD